jgi:hypothetical protein
MIADLEPDGEWAETVSLKLWSSPIAIDNSGNFKMDVDWKHRGVLRGFWTARGFQNSQTVNGWREIEFKKYWLQHPID